MDRVTSLERKLQDVTARIAANNKEDSGDDLLKEAQKIGSELAQARKQTGVAQRELERAHLRDLALPQASTGGSKARRSKARRSKVPRSRQRRNRSLRNRRKARSRRN